LSEIDYLIVGAGAAGSVLANRLSQAAGTRVLLIEAGDDIRPGEEPADIRSVFPLAAFNEHYMWRDTRVHWRRMGNSPVAPLPQGRVLGGSSTIMGMWALRGVPDDYDAWERDGATGWSWDHVLPYFRRLESDQDFNGPLHGTDGPVPIRREPYDTWSPMARVVHGEVTRRGWRHVEDLNADFGDGHCSMANSRFENSRASAGICYLTAAVRNRPNLQILTRHTVVRLLVEGRRIAGVVVRRPDGSEESFRARETILTAGALRTPVLLLQAGIGPARHLGSLGISVLADRPGVGQNLQNHPVMYVCALLKRGGREPLGLQPALGLHSPQGAHSASGSHSAPGSRSSLNGRPAAATYLRWSSGLPGCGPADLAIYVRSYLTWHALGRRMASLAPALQRPASRGSITLTDRDPRALPRIEFNFLDDERDLSRLVAATRLAADLFSSQAVQEICGDAFVLTNASRLMRYNRITRQNAVRAQLAAACVDASTRFGLALLRRFADLQLANALVAQDSELAEFVKQHVTGTGHVCGTCRMGRPDDPSATCDPTGRVYDVQGLRIADASVMPTVPSGNTHIPTVMVAEKIAASLQGETS
jgi:5-(hydroxymethyl)furfural/furfural oxidase